MEFLAKSALCVFLLNHLSMMQGRSLLSFMRGLNVPPLEYLFCVFPIPFLFCDFSYPYTQNSHFLQIRYVSILEQVFKLYERCLIACANYTECWIHYILGMDSCGSMDLAKNALARATQVFVKRQFEIHLFATRFRDHGGDIAGARASYQLVHFEISLGLLEAIIKHANMEHRLVNPEDACSLYEQTIAIEKGKEHSQALPLLFAQYSRFLYLVLGRVEKSREVPDQALESNQLSLLEALIHMVSNQSQPKQIDRLDLLVEKFIALGHDNAKAS